MQIASKPFLRFALLMGPSGLVALLAGWVSTDIWRSPGFRPFFYQANQIHVADAKHRGVDHDKGQQAEGHMQILRGENNMGIDLSIIWFTIIVFATLMYIVMDGFDLGIPSNMAVNGMLSASIITA
jgi:cytochrome bd-type quinol oxidase subunit 1